MKIPLYKEYEKTAPVGVCCMSNHGGLEILHIDDREEIAVACFNWGTGRQMIRRHKIGWTESGRAYIRKQGYRFYFDQIARCDR
jgi:hypothetical protein